MLKRIALSLRNQDWTTLVLELLIVVAGIYLGLQANDWAAARDARERETAAIERLFHESNKAHEQLAAELSRLQGLNTIRREAVAFIDSDTPIPEKDLMLRVGLNTLAQFPDTDTVRVTYDELVSSGGMQLLQSVELRTELALFHSELDWHNELSGRFGDDNGEYWSAYRRHVRWSYNPDSTTTDILLSHYNWDSMRADPDFITIAIGRLRNQLVVQASLEALLERAQALCKLLAEPLERECTAK